MSERCQAREYAGDGHWPEADADRPCPDPPVAWFADEVAEIMGFCKRHAAIFENDTWLKRVERPSS